MQDNFTGWDFVVDVIPGVILLAGVILPFSLSELVPTILRDPGVFFSVAAIGFAFVVGQLIQALSNRIYSKFIRRRGIGMSHFIKLVNDGRKKSKNEKWGVDKEIYEMMQHSLSPHNSDDIDDLKKISDNQLFDLTLRYLRGKGVQKVDHFQMLSITMRSVSVVFGFLALLYFISIPIGLITESLIILTTVELAFTTGVFVILTILCYRQYVVFQKQMARTMYRRFYTE